MQCTVEIATKDMLDFIETTSATLNVIGRTAAPLMVIGGGCPVKTDTIAKLSKFLHAVQVWWTGLVPECAQPQLKTCKAFNNCLSARLQISETHLFRWHKLNSVLRTLGSKSSCYYLQQCKWYVRRLQQNSFLLCPTRLQIMWDSPVLLTQAELRFHKL